MRKLHEWLERLAVSYLVRRNTVLAPLGMTLKGNAVAIRRKDGSYVVHLAPGADRVTVLLGSQLMQE